ncbi:hypothetical protein GH714_018560 [Hevea brasiliensis]|uniref:DUF1499 domain-containing protein n=1 Tax=Hevea brasiliensis TaxID=3981 RepID=A0A6A6L9R8_HEVBR|nr:hypothetical protein GH714_018560 [Hevea brasiliensis]
MASMAAPTTAYRGYYYKTRGKHHIGSARPRILLSHLQNGDDDNIKPSDQIARRNYNISRKEPVSREVAMEELLQVIKSTKPDKFTPRIAEKKDDYLHVEYQSPILGLVDDVEFWFPPGNDSIVEYRSASRLGNFYFDYNRKRIKTLRLELEKKGWASADSF